LHNAITRTVTIESGASLSGPFDIEGYEDIAIQMPGDWDEAAITFQAAATLFGTYQDVYDDAGTEVSVTAAADHCIVVNTATKKLSSLRFIKVRSGTGSTAVNQTADREIVLNMKK
jgi:hypothetical protein